MAEKETFLRKYRVNFYTLDLKIQFFMAISEKKQQIHDKWYDDDYVIVYIEDGKFDVLCNGKSAQLNSGDIFLCKPYEKFKLIALEENKWTNYSTISFHPALFDVCDKKSKIYRVFESRNKDELCIYKQEETTKLQDLFEKAHEYIKNSWHEDVYKSIVTLILFEISAIFDKTHQQHPAKFSHEYDLKIFSYIQSRILTPITVTDVMNEFYVSRWYIDKVCKKFYDSNFINALKTHKMWAARGFMASKKTNDLHKIAELCGYNDYSAFYKNYKNFFGISPKEDMKYYKENKEFYKK